MAGTLSVVMHVVLDGFVADVAKLEFAAYTAHFVLPTLFGIYRLARRALYAPLNVNVWVSFVSHVLLNHLLSDCNRHVKVLYLNALRALLEVHKSLCIATTRPAHVIPALSALKPSAEFLLTRLMTIVLVLVNRYPDLTFRTQFGAVLKIKSI